MRLHSPGNLNPWCHVFISCVAGWSECVHAIWLGQGLQQFARVSLVALLSVLQNYQNMLEKGTREFEVATESRKKY